MKKTWFLTYIFLLISTIFVPILSIHFYTKYYDMASSFSPKKVSIHYETNNCCMDMDLETYLCGVVLASIPTDYNLETLKAQAIISRTYALRNIEHIVKSTNICKQQKKYNDTISISQKDIGLDYIEPSSIQDNMYSGSYEAYMNKIRAAVSLTKNEVITYHGELIAPLYFQVGTGFTRDSLDVFPCQIPYLKRVSSDFDIQSADYLHTPVISLDATISLLNQAYKSKQLEASDYDYQVYESLPITPSNFISATQILERDSSGYVISINLGGVIVSGESFANALSLPSSSFYIEDYDDSVRFVCNGVGHGLGFSQYGANQLAINGFSYQEILSYYYSSIKLVSYDY